jgi:hypothetical protein
MIEMVTKEKIYKDSRHDPLHPAVPKDLRASHVGSLLLLLLLLLVLLTVVVPLLPPAPTTAF